MSIGSVEAGWVAGSVRGYNEAIFCAENVHIARALTPLLGTFLCRKCAYSTGIDTTARLLLLLGHLHGISDTMVGWHGA
jgi:hypothetical protein